MNPDKLNWTQLLKRMTENAKLLKDLDRQLHGRVTSFPAVFTELLDSGFTIPEAQELYDLLHS